MTAFGKCSLCGLEPVVEGVIDKNGWCGSCNANYTGVDNYGEPRIDYVNGVKKMNDEALYDECRKMIWFSSYANNNPRSDYHWQVDYCYSECRNRGKEEIYKLAYDRVWKENFG
jgi:hypothetical protein